MGKRHSKPKISVCIPSFNRPDLLLQTLKSVSSQSVIPYEVIVIDNHSDEDMSSIEKICNDKKYQYIKNKSNIGFVGNWNKCIDSSSGEYICILHSDDILHTDWYKEFEHSIQKHKDCDVFNCGISLIDQQNKCTDVYLPFNKSFTLNNNFKQIWDANYCALSVSGSLIIRKSVFNKIGYFKEKYRTECDAWFYYSLIKNFRIYYINKVLFGYKIHPFQTIETAKIKKNNDSKLDKLDNALSIAHDFYETELDSCHDYRFFYLKLCITRYILGLSYLVKLDKKSFLKIHKSIKSHFPDFLSETADYFVMIRMIVHYIKRNFIGKILATRYKNIFLYSI